MNAVERAAAVRAERRAAMGEEAFAQFEREVQANVQHAVHLITCSPSGEADEKGRALMLFSEAPVFGSEGCTAACPSKRALPVHMTK